MTDRPIPRRGLIGCWFLTDRGLTYNSGQDRAIDRSGKGNHASYKNGVTVGTEGPPSREFGAASFDASSNQYAVVSDPLAVSGSHATAVVAKVDSLPDDGRLIDADDTSGGYSISIDSGSVELDALVRDSGGGAEIASTGALQTGEYFSAVGFFNGSSVGLYFNASLEDTAAMQSNTPANINAEIGRDPLGLDKYLDGRIAAVARYDLTVPNAPNPSEIARSWHRLTDIPATR